MGRLWDLILLSGDDRYERKEPDDESEAGEEDRPATSMDDSTAR
jgi:hypothetical protein